MPKDMSLIHECSKKIVNSPGCDNVAGARVDNLDYSIEVRSEISRLKHAGMQRTTRA
jgi:hypothetical protein